MTENRLEELDRLQNENADLRRALAWLICESTKGCPHPCSTDAMECEGVLEELDSRVDAARKERMG